MADAKPRNSCISLFKKPKALPLQCEYIFSLMTFNVTNKVLKNSDNSAVCIVNTRNKDHLHRPITNLSHFQKKEILFRHEIVLKVL
jgi:hypothetical protein